MVELFLVKKGSISFSTPYASIRFLHISLREIVNIVKFVHKIFIWVLKMLVRVHLHWNA